MRRSLPLFAVLLLSVSAFAQPAPAPQLPPQTAVRPNVPPGLSRCCAPKVLDANGKEVGEIIRYDDRFPTVPLNAWVRYELKGGDTVAISVGPETISGPVGLGGSAVVFTAIDCSGDAFIAALSNPPLTKRYAVILPGGAPGSWPFQLTNAWLYVTDPFPARVNAGATVFKSQWSEQNQCSPYPAPGLTFSGTQYGFWAHKVEDLYAKFKRPFWVP